MSSRFDKRWVCSLLAGLLVMASGQTVQAQFGPVIQQIGGVWINPDGALAEVTVDMQREARRLVADSVTGPPQVLSEATELRMISLKALEGALAEAAQQGKELPDDIKYMAGIQRLQYVLVDPERNDIILAGPGEGWTVDAAGNVVGVRSGRPVVRFEDFIVALRTSDNARQGAGISVSINPTEEGQRRLETLFKRQGFRPEMREQIENALGPQDISLTGLPADTRLAQILVAADYHMKRLGMGFEHAAIDGLPSVLEMAFDRGRGVKMTPRFWLECSYQPLRRSADGLTWQLEGPGAKALTENQIVSGGQVKKVKDHPIARQWSENLTDKFAKLADADPIFAELQNVMDMAVIAALIQKHDLLKTAELQIPTVLGENDDVALPKWSVPQTVSTQCSFVRIKQSWMVTASGGVQVDSWSVLENTRIDDTVAQVRARAALDTGQAWWNAVN